MAESKSELPIKPPDTKPPLGGVKPPEVNPPVGPGHGEVSEETKAKVEAKVVDAQVQQEMDECLTEATKILKRWGGEANVPYNSGYWGLMNRYRGLNQVP